MPNKSKNITPVTSPQLLTPSGSHSVSSNSGRSMPPTTRSMQGRLSNITQSSSPYVQAGPSLGSTQQGPSPRATNATASDVESSDDDEASEEEEDESSSGEEESDEEDGEDDSDDDDDDIPTKILKIFAIAEPNGLIESEIRDEAAVNAQVNQAS
jgi:hypothetical protein